MAHGVIADVQVNIPFRMLKTQEYLSLFLEHGLNPEIGLDAATLDQASKEEFMDVFAAFRERGRCITCHAPFLDLSAGSLDPAVRSVTRMRFEQTLDAVACFHPMTVVCHTGWDHRRYSAFRGMWLERSLEVWTWFAEAVQDRGARLMLENVYERWPEELFECCDSLRGAGVGVCLDTGHLSAFAEDPLDRWLDVLMQDIGQLHLHDNHGDSDEHLAMGRGIVDFPRLFQRLVGQGVTRPVVTLEPHTEEAFHDSLAYLRGVWPWEVQNDSH